VTKLLSGIVDFGGGLWVIRIDILDCDGEVDKILGKVAEKQAHERLEGATRRAREISYKWGMVKNKYTNLGGAGCHSRDKTNAIQGELRVSGEASDKKMKKMLMGCEKRMRTDRKRPVNGTGFRSLSGVEGMPSWVRGWSEAEGEGGGESCFDLSQEKRPFGGGEEAFSFSMLASTDMKERLGETASGRKRRDSWCTHWSFGSFSIYARKTTTEHLSRLTGPERSYGSYIHPLYGLRHWRVTTALFRMVRLVTK
jgi:hypothetical protein